MTQPSGTLTTPAARRQSLRVLMVAAAYFPHMGGIETHVYEVGRRMATAGVAVTVLTTDTTRSLPPQERREGIDIVRVPAFPSGRDYYFAPQILRMIRWGGWDVIHVQGIHTLVPPLAMFAAVRSGIPFVVTFHTGGHTSRLRTMLRGAQWLLLRPLLARADRLIGVSTFEAELFRSKLHLPGSRFRVIQNGGRLPIVDPSITPDPATPLIVSTGRLEEYKGHQRVIAAMPAVRAQCPSARLLILGSGPYEAELRRLAIQYGVVDCVEIRSVPPSDREGMAAILARATLVTLLSAYEAHPVAVMEALALRRPVLVADTSGLREIAQRGLARSIPLHSPPASVAAAIVLGLRQPMAPPEVALPTWEGCTEQLLALYREIARPATPAREPARQTKWLTEQD